MHRLTILPLVLLAACGGKRDGMPESFRDTDTPIYSNAVLDPAELEGTWTQAATFAPEAGGCKPGTVRFGRPDGGAIPVTADLCLGGKSQKISGRAAMPVPGRLVPESVGSAAVADGIGQAWWIVWADVDMRTLVIGTPSGEMGFILNRDGRLPADRLAAAREILEWNGYDLEHLQTF